jgi:glutaminase
MKNQLFKTLLVSGIFLSHALFSYGQNTFEKDNIQKVQEEAWNDTKSVAGGKIYKTGNSDYEFGIESISKVFVLALAMQTVDPDTRLPQTCITAPLPCCWQMAIAVFAPPLDEAGNSVKAQKAIAFIAKKLGLNIYQP